MADSAELAQALGWLKAAGAMNDVARLELRAAVTDALKAGGEPGRVARLASVTEGQVLSWGREAGVVAVSGPADLDERRARRGGDWQRLVAEAERQFRRGEDPD